MAKITTTDLDVFPLALGGNVFGWTANEEESVAVLDAYVTAGGNFIDTADMLSEWASGNAGGESEAIIGRWMKTRGNRDHVIIGTKVGMLTRLSGLSAKTIRNAAEESLRRLQTDRIDLYYAHADDPETPLEETLGEFDALVREGKVRYIAASNYSAPRLAEALTPCA
jgi:aryl-alcohol dehydrogenase-like predicted oxidoreductase